MVWNSLHWMTIGALEVVTMTMNQRIKMRPVEGGWRLMVKMSSLRFSGEWWLEPLQERTWKEALLWRYAERSVLSQMLAQISSVGFGSCPVVWSLSRICSGGYSQWHLGGNSLDSSSGHNAWLLLLLLPVSSWYTSLSYVETSQSWKSDILFQIYFIYMFCFPYPTSIR